MTVTNKDRRQSAPVVGINSATVPSAYERGIPDAPCVAYTPSADQHVIRLDAINGFTTGTLILSDRGRTPVEMLRPGDMVVTRDHAFQPIRWIGRHKLSARDLAEHPNLRPIRIETGVLGHGAPLNNLLLSPQHRIFLRSKFAKSQFGSDEVLVAVRELLAIEGIDIAEDLDEVEYVHFLCDDHEIVISNGAWTESMYPSPQTLNAMDKEIVEEIFDIFPELYNRYPNTTPKGARMLLTGCQGRNLAELHSNSNRPLLM